jgi:RNA polymerase sigma-70 factor (ECF subfamily)
MRFWSARTAEFDQLTAPCAGELLRFAIWRLGNRLDAEDVVQETYLKAFRAFDKFDKTTRVKPWLMRILINTINDHFRRRSTQPEMLAFEEHLLEVESVPWDACSVQNPEARLSAQEFDIQLMNAIKALPGVLSYPLLLREFEGYTYAEIAGILDVPLGTVMSRLFRARQLLRKELEDKSTSKKLTEVLEHELQ